MQFGRVHGRIYSSSSCAGYMLNVLLEEGTRSTTIREECFSTLPFVDAARDLRWWADQLTQETIGTTLAVEGWEAVAESTGDRDRASTDSGTVTYVVRRV